MAAITPTGTPGLPAAPLTPVGTIDQANQTLTALTSVANSLGIPVPGGAAPAAATPGANATASTAFVPAPAPNVVGGGGAIRNAVEALASFAQQKIDKTKVDVQTLAANSGQNVNVAELQRLNNEMEQGNQLMSLAAKIEEKQNEAIRTWLRP